MNTKTARTFPTDHIDTRADGAVLYQMAPCASTQMMGYIIRTKGGRLFLIDGGTKKETDAFLALARRAVGCPDGEKLHIDGWFLTHPHDDHIDVLIDTVSNRLNTVEIEHLWYNFPSTAYQEKYENHFSYTCRDFDAIRGIIEPFATVVHPGDVFDYDDVRFEILTEPDETITVNTGNNSSVCIRVTIEGQTILFLGDMGVEQGQAFLAKYGEENVKADFVEMAHHGQNGVDYPVYAAIRPKACLWCAPDWLWTNNAGGGYGTGPWKTLHVRCFMDDLGVKHHFVEKDGIWEIPLPYHFD